MPPPTCICSTCDEAVCLFVYSGKGVLSGSVCVYESGFKGKEGEMRHNWREVSNCNGRGRCDTCEDTDVSQDGLAKHVNNVLAHFRNAMIEDRDETSVVFLLMSWFQLHKHKKKHIHVLIMANLLMIFVNAKLDGVLLTALKEIVNVSMKSVLKEESVSVGKDGEEQIELKRSVQLVAKITENALLIKLANARLDEMEITCVMDRRSSESSCRCQAGSTGIDCSIPVEMHCDDGLDNDSDGLIDCDDQECGSSSSCSSESVCSTTDSSRIVVDSKSIVESLPIQGTDIRLIYDSSRSPAALSTLLIGLLDDKIDKDLRKVHDKMNADRQSDSGLVPVTVEVGYEYQGCDRNSERVWQTRKSQMLGAVARKMLGAMWTIDGQHLLDIVNNIVEMGNGGYRLISESEPRVSTLAGIDSVKRDVECSKCDGRVESIRIFRPTTVVYAEGGSFIIGDHNLTRRVTPDGQVTTILTLGLADTSHSYYIAVSPTDGTIAISLPLHKQVWRITSLEPQDSRNNYDVIAGDGTVCGSAVDSCGDDALAQNAQLIYPKGIAFDEVGNLYLADSRRIRVIDTTGHIRSIGETTPDQHPIRTFAQITKLVDVQMEWPTSLSIDPITDSVLVFDTNVVYKIDVEHDVVTVALGSPTTCDIANTTSLFSTTSSASFILDHRRHLIQNARDISLGREGVIYVVESDGRRLNQKRVHVHVMLLPVDDEVSLRDVAASQAHLNSPYAVCVAPSGDVIVADSGNSKIKKISSRLANYDGRSRSYEVPDVERQEKYTFNLNSHVSMISKIRAASGVLLRILKRNESIYDLETTLGKRTTHIMSTYDGTLEQVSKRDSATSRDATKLSYSKGLLSSRIDEATAVEFEYDKYGRAVGLRRDFLLNEKRFQQVRLGDEDLAVHGTIGASTLISLLRNEGYSLTSPSGTSSLFVKSSTIPDVGGEPVISCRRTTVPSIGNPQRRALTTQWDWKHVARRGEESDNNFGRRRVAEINGVNMFSMEYDVKSNSDSGMTWGSWKTRLIYDNSNRLTEHAVDGARVPVKMSYAGASRRPNEIQHDGAKWTIQYDNYDRNKEVLSKSQESTTFSAIALGGDEWVLKRRTSLNSKPSLVRIARDRKILEATTPDEMHHWLERKDQTTGRTTEILNDDETTVVTCWSPEGQAMCTRSRDFQENTTMQGHLIARKTATIMTPSVTTIQPVIEQSFLESIQLSYDERREHVSSVNGLTWGRDVSTTRCQGHGLMYETSKADEHRQVVERKLIFGDITSSGVQRNHKITRTFDAAGRVASVEQTDQEPTRIQYNSDARVEKINDRIVEWNPIVGDSNIIRIIERSMFGSPLTSSSSQVYLPIGYLGGIEIPEISVSILSNGRPFDLHNGRYIRVYFSDFVTLFLLAGFSNNLLPSAHFGFPVASSIVHLLSLLSHLTAVFPTSLASDFSLSTSVSESSWSIDDVGFSNLLILYEDVSSGDISFKRLPDLKPEERDAIRCLMTVS
ncbi:CBN-TEN-1 protein [Caenorhabditis brenneri]|uniref:CBN-TEN-1 protein n=1 Tax=Caenorhabditis brenneri TaxID=135651 RepID=G0MGZ1_CAEBE|nr:CBN-TEN-1 protein [Caenorhabditis brenneri]